MEGRDMSDTVDFGWGAPSLGEQFPQMPKDVAAQLDADSAALIRLRIRGYVTDSQRNSIMRKLAKAVGKAIPND